MIRTLPQNVATIGAITNERGKGPLTNRNAPVSQLGALGVAAANLGGLGAGNTLILVNGRRVPERGWRFRPCRSRSVQEPDRMSLASIEATGREPMTGSA